MRESIAAARKKLKRSFRAYHDQKLVSLLGNADHPSRNFPYVNTNLGNVDDDTLYQRIEEFKKRHYSAHRMGLCLQTNLSLDEMQVQLHTTYYNQIEQIMSP